LEISCLFAIATCGLTAWQNNSHPHQLGICSSTSPGTVSQAGFNSSYSEGLPPGLSGNIYGSVSSAWLFYFPPFFAIKICTVVDTALFSECVD